MKMRVCEVITETDAVRVYTLCHPRREHLPPPTPGSHVDLHLPDGKIRQYSLCGDPDDDTVYRIAVKREDAGRGASRWIHDNLRPGSVVPVSAPRNNFPLGQGCHHVFIAGGIGITPVLAMARYIARREGSFEIHYCARDARNAPFLAAIGDLCGPRRLSTYFSSPNGAPLGRLDVERLLKTAIPSTHVYCCGPQRLTEAFLATAINWPKGYVHCEVFKPTLDENFIPEPFDIRLVSTGEVLRVPAEKSALDVLRAHGVGLPSSCQLGVCGSCMCRYVEGTVIHRDSILDVAARQDQMILCVSRARVNVTLDI
ncbi:MAG: PDR/VanB family oxidoreductase [Xanthobacteraceae bacterium]